MPSLKKADVFLRQHLKRLPKNNVSPAKATVRAIIMIHRSNEIVFLFLPFILKSKNFKWKYNKPVQKENNIIFISFALHVSSRHIYSFVIFACEKPFNEVMRPLWDEEYTFFYDSCMNGINHRELIKITLLSMKCTFWLGRCFWLWMYPSVRIHIRSFVGCFQVRDCFRSIKTFESSLFTISSYWKALFIRRPGPGCSKAD